MCMHARMYVRVHVHAYKLVKQESLYAYNNAMLGIL